MNERFNAPGPEPDDPDGPESDNLLHQAQTAWQSTGGKLLAAIPAVAALAIGLGIGGALSGSSKTNTVTEQGPTVTITEAATVPSSTSPGGDGTGGTTTTPTGTVPPSSTAAVPTVNPTQVGIVPLVDLTPATGPWKSQISSPMLNGTLQQFSIQQDLQDANNNGDVGYNLGRDYTKLTGLIGLDDNSPKSMLHPTIEVDGDGLKIATYTPTLGHPAQITINVSGVLRLDIKYISLDSDDNASTAGTLILGNGQLTTIPGYNPPPPSSS
jgi:hypothetical protein